MSLEVDVENGQKLHFLKCTFLLKMHFATKCPRENLEQNKLFRQKN